LKKEAKTFASWNLHSLRFRLAAAMLLVFLAALLASSALDRLNTKPVSPDQEPYQDALILGAFSLAVLLLIWLVSQWSLKPLARASDEAARAGPRHPGVRLSTKSLPTEITPLVAAMNGALERLEHAYEAERRFTADAAHELRTPLSVLKLRLQRARIDNAPDWKAIEGDLAQMTHLVNQLLNMARKEQAGREATSRPVNLARIAREAASMITPLAEAANRRLLVDLPETLPLLGRADDLRDMLLNVLDNALAHGSGTITLLGMQAETLCRIEIGDEGPGVAPALREAMFQRFRKAQPSSPGTGLGLAIVREVAESHGGSVSFADAATGLVRIELPCKKNLLF